MEKGGFEAFDPIRPEHISSAGSAAYPARKKEKKKPQHSHAVAAFAEAIRNMTETAHPKMGAATPGVFAASVQDSAMGKLDEAKNALLKMKKKDTPPPDFGGTTRR